MRYLFLFFILFQSMAYGQVDTIYGPTQLPSGPGGADYKHAAVHFQDFAEDEEGYWLFEPAEPRPDSAGLVVFIHGYGAYNPMIYGKWIKHLVRKGNIVVFPRYQKNIFSPGPKEFGDNTSQAIKDALEELNSGDHVRPIVEPLVLAGHSYGGVIAADLGVNFERYQIPKPAGILMCSPGTGPFKGGRLDSYEDMPADTRLLILVSEGDKVVGDEFANLVFETAVHTPDRYLFRQSADDHGFPAIRDGHNQAYSLDEEFDTGVHNMTFKRAERAASFDAIDYNGYWKLLDGMLDCLRHGSHCEYAFGNSPEQKNLGLWSDGRPVNELEVFVPETGDQTAKNTLGKKE